MNFHPDDFLSLIQEVEEQGGAHLSGEVCKPTRFRLNYPIDEDNPRGPKASKVFATAGCHRHAKFLVQLLPDEYFIQRHSTEDLGEMMELMDFDDRAHPQAELSDGSPALAKVCAVDDALGLWPRYQDAMHTGESFQEF